MSDHHVSFPIDNSADAPKADSAEPVLRFVCDPSIYGTIPEPARAPQFAPDWFRNLARETTRNTREGETVPVKTAKACPPMVDAFTLGHIIPLAYDVHLNVPENGQNIAFSADEACVFSPISDHDPEQLGAPKPPFEQVHPLKFINPWRVIAPEGYSVLFAPVLNRPDQPFYCFAGFVDCDRFDATVNFPFVWTGPPGEHTIPAGTPLVQAIAIRRDTLIKPFGARAATAEELMDMAAAMHAIYSEDDAYQNHWRVRK